MAQQSTPIAIIETGAKQYLVKQGDTILVEKLPQGAIKFKDLMTGKHVEAEVARERKGPKVHILKYKSKTRYHKRTGHRQTFSELVIKKIA
ncbi:50S ribosomal protein L21 [Candidatus Berkelbacteria bacterium]|nr:50S ribosomal protein L21 [Candidatus Berkelbacteria bacterium]